ncbi:hypothetical protein [Streptomyces sp. NBC_01465]|uniref:hypothetical protein n=1 Tax=Streptomyces sp. NBC_01465 TaxID=2903878 RepID=UPI002E35CFCB|nr:hypothetical protein [Streptomyces sp. NBC_01465]
MSMHTRRRTYLGAVTGVVLLVGGGFAVQATADSGAKASPAVQPAVQPAAKPAAPAATGSPKVVEAGTSGTGTGAGNAPRVIDPGHGVKK